MIYKNITPAEALQLVLDGKQTELYFRNENTGAILPLDRNSVCVNDVVSREWFQECDNGMGFSLRDVIKFTLDKTSYGSVDDIEHDFLKVLKESGTSE